MDLQRRGIRSTRAELANAFFGQFLNGQIYLQHAVLDLMTNFLEVADEAAQTKAVRHAGENGHETWEVEKRLEIITNSDGSKTARKVFSLQADGQDEKYELSSNPIPSGMIGLARAMHEGMEGYEKSSVSEAAVLDALKPGKVLA